MNAEREWTDVCLCVFDLFFKVNGVTVPGREIPVTLNPAAIDEENRFFYFDGSDGFEIIAITICADKVDNPDCTLYYLHKVRLNPGERETEYCTNEGRRTT